MVPLKEQRQVALSAVHNIHAAQGHTAFKVLPMLVYSDRISGDAKSKRIYQDYATRESAIAVDTLRKW